PGPKRSRWIFASGASRSPLKLSPLTSADRSRGIRSVRSPLTLSRWTSPSLASASFRSMSPDTVLASSLRTRSPRLSRRMLPETVSSEISPPSRPCSERSPLTVPTSTWLLLSESRRSPLTVSMLALRGAPTATTSPLTDSSDNSRGALPCIWMSADTVSTSRSASSGICTTSTVGSARDERDGYLTSIRSASRAPSTRSLSTPSPRLPVILTSGRSQARTSTRPLRFSISTLPRGSSGRVWLIGVAADAGNAAMHASASREPIRTVRMFDSSGIKGAARQREPAGIGLAQLLQQQPRIRVHAQRGADLRGAAIQRLQPGLPAGMHRADFELAEGGTVLRGHRIRLALDQAGHGLRLPGG